VNFDEQVASACKLFSRVLGGAVAVPLAEDIMLWLRKARPGRTPWRVGSTIPRNLYDADDNDIGRMDTAELAGRVVAAVNADDASWLVKDFDVLYRSALDVSESVLDPDGASPPLRQLRAQLARLKTAFEHVQSLKASLREPRQ